MELAWNTYGTLNIVYFVEVEESEEIYVIRFCVLKGRENIATHTKYMCNKVWFSEAGMRKTSQYDVENYTKITSIYEIKRISSPEKK